MNFNVQFNFSTLRPIQRPVFSKGLNITTCFKGLGFFAPLVLEQGSQFCKAYIEFSIPCISTPKAL